MLNIDLFQVPVFSATGSIGNFSFVLLQRLMQELAKNNTNPSAASGLLGSILLNYYINKLNWVNQTRSICSKLFFLRVQ